MNNGKSLEYLVSIIQEALIDHPKTEVLTNYRINNRGNSKREFDILLKSNINGFPFNIAIECKDYKRPVPVEKMEAFIHKCQRIPEINKLVFVTTNGYQKDSIKAAEESGVDLFQLKKISPSTILSWFPIFNLIPNIKLKTPFKIYARASEIQLKKFEDKELSVFDYSGTQDPIGMLSFVWNSVVKTRNEEIRNYMLLDFMKGNCRNQDGKRTIMPFNLDIKGAYILNSENQKIQLVKIESEIVAWFEEQSAQIESLHRFGKIEEQNFTTVVTSANLFGHKADIVISGENDYSIFSRDEKGNTIKLKRLISYDPVSKKFEFPSNQ